MLLLVQIWRRASSWLDRHSSSPSVSSALFCGLFVFGIVCRLLFGARLFAEDITPMSFVANRWSFLQGLRFFVWDLLFALVLSLVARGASRWIGRGKPSRTLQFVGWATLLGSLGVIGGITGAHYDLVFETHSGLKYNVLTEVLAAGTPEDVLGYATRAALSLTVLPTVLVVGFFLLGSRGARPRARVFFWLTLGTLLLQLPSALLSVLGKEPATPHFALRSVPAYYVTQDVAQALLLPRGKMRKRQDRMPALVAEHARLTGDRYELDVPRPPPLEKPEDGEGTGAKQPWNVLFIVMESTGARYLDHITGQGERPMPFVEGLRERGTSLEFHMATGNTSPRSIFSIFSGIYPLPDHSLFCTRKDVALPGLGTFLGESYEKFLVTPGRVQSYFPLAFMRNTGLTDIEDYYSLPETGRTGFSGGRHELDAVDRMVERLRQAKEPFWGTYYSYAPHYHYYDYGPEYRIEPGEDAKSRYLNNLRLLDTQIERIFSVLERQSLLARTVVVLVGDHGEAFGQHPENFTHARASYVENLHAPAIFYQPKLFPPKKVKCTTSHVDLLPTLLEALEIPFQEEQFQGESLFRPRRQKYHFSVGNEVALSSVDPDKKKVLVNFRKDTCHAFDLQTDPLEDSPLPCAGHQEQVDALLQFGKHWRWELPAENERAKKKARQ